MSFNDQSSGEPTNKEETEIPIGTPREPAQQDHRMWRCSDCGEMGRLRERGTLPAECPACASPKEDLYYWEED